MRLGREAVQHVWVQDILHDLGTRHAGKMCCKALIRDARNLICECVDERLDGVHLLTLYDMLGATVTEELGHHLAYLLVVHGARARRNVVLLQVV